MFCYITVSERGKGPMNENECELIHLIRSCDDPQKALVTAIEIICQCIENGCVNSMPLDFSKQAI